MRESWQEVSVSLEVNCRYTGVGMRTPPAGDHEGKWLLAANIGLGHSRAGGAIHRECLSLILSSAVNGERCARVPYSARQQIFLGVRAEPIPST